MAKQKSKQNFTIKVEGVEAVKRGLKKLAEEAKKRIQAQKKIVTKSY